jgi:uridine kinase
MRPSVPSPGATGRPPEPMVVLVDGIDGSGKTSLAGRLAEALRTDGRPVALVHVDDFRRPVTWDDPRGEAELYWSCYFDLAALQTAVAILSASGTMVVLEGVFTLRLPELATSPLVYLEVDFEEAARRIVLRDTARGRTREDVLHRIEARYFPAQRRYRAEYSPCVRATMLIDSTDPAALRLIRSDWPRFPASVAAALRPLLGLEPA